MKIHQTINIIWLTFTWLVICIKSTTEITNIEEIKTKNDSFEVRLISWYKNESIYEIKFVNFDDFKAINFWNFNLSRYKFGPIIIHFLPNKKTLLDLKIKTNHFTLFKVHITYVLFYNVKGFDVDLFSLRFSPSNNRNILFFFSLTNFIFFKNHKIIHKSTCKINAFSVDFYFQLNYIFFNYGTSYSTETCKFIFKNSTINKIEFNSITNSLIKKNQLSFIPYESQNINSSIREVTFSVYKIKADNRLLDQDVFERVIVINFKGEISAIENNLFQQLNYLLMIRIVSLNVRKLLSSGIEWMNSLSKIQISDMSNRMEIIQKLHGLTIIGTFSIEELYDDYINSNYLQKPYLYPDEDFCWFKDFPFERLVFLNPHTYCDNNCSCTQYWLLQYAYLIKMSPKALFYLHMLSLNEDRVFQILKYKQEIEKCNFKERLKKCETDKFSTTQVGRLSSLQSALIDSQIVDFVIVILTPILGTLGIIVNIINIVTISKIDLNKTPEEKQQKTLIRFMLVYSIINLVYCVIHCLSLMSKCVDLDSLFCSEAYFIQFVQWYKIIFVEFMSASLKIFSNLLYFCMSVNRYVLFEQETKLAGFIRRTLGEWSTKKKTFWIVFISIVLIGLNSHKIVIYKVMDYSVTNAFFDQYPEFFFSLPFFLASSRVYDFPRNYLTPKEVDDRSIVYQVFTYFNFVLNDIVFYLLFTVVDILLVVAFKKATEKKKNIHKENLNDEKIQKLLTDMEQNGKNIMRVIIVNCCILLVIKVFDLFLSVSKFNIWKDDLVNTDSRIKLNAFCHTSKICSVYEELVKIAYMLHYSFSIVCFYFLNKNFKIKLKTWFCRVKSTK